MRFTKVRTRENTTIYFVLLSKNLNYNEIQEYLKENFDNKKEYKVLGPIDYLSNDSILYYLDILPGGVFKNYDNKVPTLNFSSPIASLKSACFSTNIHLEQKDDEFILVIVESNQENEF